MKQSDKDLIISNWNDGQPISAIIKLLPYDKVTSRALIQELLDSGEILWENKKGYSRTERILTNAYKNGMTNVYELADTYNYSPKTVSIVLRKSGVKSGRPEHNYRRRRSKHYELLSDITKKCIELLKENKGCAEIAQELGCSRQNVHIIKKRYFPEKVVSQVHNKNKGE
jgi:DNA-binding CsgD family transcriptional regulator